MLCKETSHMIIWKTKVSAIVWIHENSPTLSRKRLVFLGCSYAWWHCLTVRCRSNGIIPQTSSLSPHKDSEHRSYNGVRNQRATAYIFPPRIQLPLTSSLNIGLVGVGDDQCFQVYGNNVLSGLMRCLQVSSFVFMCSKRSACVTPCRPKCWKRMPMGWNWPFFSRLLWDQIVDAKILLQLACVCLSTILYLQPSFFVTSQMLALNIKAVLGVTWSIATPHPIVFDH